MNKFSKSVLIFLLSGYFLMNPILSVFASPYETYLQKAREYLQEENFNEAIKELETVLALIRPKAKLEFNKVQFVREDPQGYGIYQPLERNTFQSGETIFIYGEPKNFSIKEIKEGIFEIYLKEDLYLLDQDNNILFGQIDILEYRVQSRSPNSDIFFTNYITQEQPFPPGNYKIRLVVKDVYSQRSEEVTLDFEIE